MMLDNVLLMSMQTYSLNVPRKVNDEKKLICTMTRVKWHVTDGWILNKKFQSRIIDDSWKCEA